MLAIRVDPLSLRRLGRGLAGGAMVFGAGMLILAAQDALLESDASLPAPPPILDGYRADPDIRVFGDTYYIYLNDTRIPRSLLRLG